MQQLDRLLETGKCIPAAQVGRYGVFERPRVQRLEHFGPQGPLADTRCRGIDRRQRFGKRLIAGDKAVARMHHLAQARLAECAHELPVFYGALEGSNLALMKMEEPQDERPLCVDDELTLA